MPTQLLSLKLRSLIIPASLIFLKIIFSNDNLMATREQIILPSSNSYNGCSYLAKISISSCSQDTSENEFSSALSMASEGCGRGGDASSSFVGGLFSLT